MILTLTPNPSLDRTVTLPGPLQRGAVNRLETVTVEPGGKGVNVARVLASSGQEATALLPVSDRDPLLTAIEDLALPGLTALPVPVASAARVNTAVTEPDGTTTKINEPGAGLSGREVAALEQALLDALGGAEPALATTAAPAPRPVPSQPGEASWAVLSGSLPPGAPVDWYVRLVGLLRPLGVLIAVDTSDAPLAALAAALPGAAPDLVKPNGEELAQLAGVGATDLEEAALAGDLAPVAAAARVLVDQGVGAVMATLGPAGAVLATSEGVWHATAPEVPVVSTVGAGDSSVAGYVLAHVRGGDEGERLRTAMAYGSAAASLPGTALPTPADLPQVQATVTRLG